MLSELDFLCNMLNDFLSLGNERNTYYARLSSTAHPLSAPSDGSGGFGDDGNSNGAGGERRAFLARMTTAKMFDYAGRLWQVRAAARQGPNGRPPALPGSASFEESWPAH
jgi:hypothetical protein